MGNLTDEELRKAFRIWQRNDEGRGHEGREEEAALGPFLSDQIKVFAPGEPGWLRRARQGLLLSAETLAERLQVSRAAYSKYEDSEERGSITLATLANAAEAMDCELVYAVRPKAKTYFSRIIWAKLLPRSLRHPWLKTCDQRKRAEGLAYIVKTLVNNPKFRKEQGWSQRVKR